MPTHQEKRRLPFAARDMYEIVADVERYPEFIPWCAGLTVRSRQSEGESEILEAAMTVGFQAVRERFECRVVLQPAALAVSVRDLAGPFRHLDNRWRFVPGTEQSCTVDFYIDWEFRSLPLRLLAGAFFEKALHHMVAAFVGRAGALHPRR